MKLNQCFVYLWDGCTRALFKRQAFLLRTMGVIVLCQAAKKLLEWPVGLICLTWCCASLRCEFCMHFDDDAQTIYRAVLICMSNVRGTVILFAIILLAQAFGWNYLHNLLSSGLWHRCDLLCSYADWRHDQTILAFIYDWHLWFFSFCKNANTSSNGEKQNTVVNCGEIFRHWNR